MKFPLDPTLRKSTFGGSITETMVSVALATIGITSLCVANANCLSIARAHRELLVADQCLQQRTEQFRAANWLQITDPTSVTTLLNAPALGTAAQLQDQKETITISAYPPVTPAAAPIVVTRDNNSSTTSVLSQPPSGFNLRASLAVRIDFQESWTSSQGKRTRVRETSTVIALGGLLH